MVITKLQNNFVNLSLGAVSSFVKKHPETMLLRRMGTSGSAATLPVQTIALF